LLATRRSGIEKLLIAMRNLVCLLVLVIISCQDKENDARLKEMELEIQKKELELKEKELELKGKDYKDSLAEIDRLSNEKLSLADLYDENKKSVFLIIAENDYESASGSGFFIREDGLAVSNYHVFKNADRAVIYTDDQEKFMINEIVDYNVAEDYIIFKISNTSGARFKPVTIASSIPRIGEECFAIGNPQGLIQTLSKGIVSNLREKEIQTTAQITFGSSGGALFNEYGEAIGITSRGKGQADLNFAIDIVTTDFLTPYLKSNDFTETSLTSSDKSKINTVLQRYFGLLNNNQIESVRYLYADVLSRCYNKLNLSREKVMQEHFSYFKTYPYQKATVFYDTIEISRDYDGTYYVNFKMDFTISKPSWSKSKTFRNDIFMSFDENMKITSIYNNIIK
jgi:serine protease Do